MLPNNIHITDAANPPVFTGRHNLADGQTIQINAWRGTQLISRHTGDPLNATDYGRYELIVTDSDGNVAVLHLTNLDDNRALEAMIGRADRVADSRDGAQDRYPPEDE